MYCTVLHLQNLILRSVRGRGRLKINLKFLVQKGSRSQAPTHYDGNTVDGDGNDLCSREEDVNDRIFAKAPAMAPRRTSKLRFLIQVCVGCNGNSGRDDEQ